ncbi:hypothetical protein V3595_16230 [Bacillus sp. CFBP9009]
MNELELKCMRGICQVADPFFRCDYEFQAKLGRRKKKLPFDEEAYGWNNQHVADDTLKKSAVIKELKRGIANRGNKESYTMEEWQWEIWKRHCH